MTKFKSLIEAFWARWQLQAKKLKVSPQKSAAACIGLLVLLGFYSISKGSDDSKRAIATDRKGEFKKTRVLGDPYANLSQAKERLWEDSARDITNSQKDLEQKLAEAASRLSSLEDKISRNEVAPSPMNDPSMPGIDLAATQTAGFGDHGVSNSNTLTELPNTPASTLPSRRQIAEPERRLFPQVTESRSMPRGPMILSFPVESKPLKEKTEVTLPVGSYVKAKLLTGVEAPEGKTYPVLMQLDFANILPNRKSLDLKGCFMIAKAQGDLSTERVQMQATKLSCVARDGQMFERDINGFVADSADNSFAIVGTVNSKQDRVAAMAFLSSVVEGVGKAIQMAQTTEQTSAEGNSRRLLTGSQEKYIAAGGASSAAGMVAQWYLNQAQNLLPTINIGSGKDVWIVMNESVALPNHYFKRQALGDGHGKDFSFVNQLFD